MNEQKIARLVDAQAEARHRTEVAALSVLERLVRAMLGFWYDETRLSQFARDASAVTNSAQQRVGAITAEYLDTVLKEIGATPGRERYRSEPDVRGIEPQKEWRRPAEQFRYLRSVGATEADAQSQASDRAKRLLLDDVALSNRKASQQRLVDASKVIGYRRVIHPEQSVGGSCGLCVVASDRVYRVDDLMPVHSLCHCEPMPITRANDPGQRLNDGDLQKIYDAAGGTTDGDRLKRVRFRVVDHSELGPQLVAASPGSGDPVEEIVKPAAAA